MALPDIKQIITPVVLTWSIVLAACSGSTSSAPPEPDPDPVAQLRVLEQHVDDAIKNKKLARENGYVYAVDIAQLMTDAALSGNTKRYALLNTLATQNLIIHRKADRYTRYFVAWRYDPTGQTPLDASGTTEALRLAEALWLAQPSDTRPQSPLEYSGRALAAQIIAAYSRHAATDQGVWMVRNYFNLETRSFSINSYLIDYDPDLMAMTSIIHTEPLLERSISIVRDAISESGLIKPLLQPELLTLRPEPKPGQSKTAAAIFAPDNNIQFTNAITVALRSVNTVPEAKDALLRFLDKRPLDSLRMFHDATTGNPVPLDSDVTPAAHDWAILYRFAIASKRIGLAERIRPLLLIHTQYLVDHPNSRSLFAISEILPALRLVIDRAK